MNEPQIKPREFEYEITGLDEAQTAEVAEVIKQHADFVTNGFKDHIAPEALEQTIADRVKETESAKAEQKIRNDKLIQIATGKVLKGSERDIIALSNISKEDSLEQATIKIDQAIKDRPNFSPKGVPGITKVATKVIATPPKEKPKKERTFFK